MKSFKLFNEAEREAGYKMPKHVADAQKKFDAQSKQKKPAQAGTLAAKRNMKKEENVVEEVEQIDELTNMKSYKMAYLLKLIKDGEWEAYSDVKPRKHVTLTRLKDGKKVTVFVEEVQLGEVTAAQASKILGGPVKTKPKGPPGKHPLGYRLARSAARKAMKSAMKKEQTEELEEMEKKPKEVKDMSTAALKQYWNRHKDEERPAPMLAAHLRKIAAELRKRQALKKESVDLQESHFKVGDEVACLRSGKTGVVTKVDPSGKGAYYTVKRADGSVMKFAPDEIKKVAKEAKKVSALSKARKDAMKAIKKDKDLAFRDDDDDVKASDDDVKAASKNPVMQLRRISDLDGTGEMEFKNGKKGKVSSADAKKLLKMFDMLKMPKEKEMFQNVVGKSLDDLKSVLKAPIKPAPAFKQKIKGTRYMTGFKWDNED